MNYRTMVKGALAFSLSLIVGSASAAVSTNSVPQYGVTFEAAVSTTAPLNDRPYVADTLIGTNNPTVGEDSYGWFAGSADDESKIIAANGGQALQLNTDSATLTNKLASADKTAINNAIAADGAFFETEIKFVASDSLDAGIKGGEDATKFAIYAYCDEEATPCTTNLVVFHAYVDDNGGVDYTNEVFATLIDTEVYTKLRIEMKKMDAGSDGLMNVFSVKVGESDPISSATAFDAYLNETETGAWFLTVENADLDADNAKVASLNFKGTGEIDNINVGVIQIETTSATVIFVADDGTTELDRQTLEVGATPAYAGEASGTNNTATASGISTFTGWTCGSDFYAVGAALPAAVNGETTYVATFSTVPAVASVNGAYYASLADAVAAAIAAGGADPVVLNGNVALDDWILVDGAVTIDLAGYTISKGANWIVATPAHDALVAVVHGGSLTVNDSSDPSTGMIDGSTLPCGIKMTIAGDTDDTNPATLVVNGGTIKGQNYAIAGNGLAGRGNTAITINGGVILGTDPTGDSCGIFHPQAGTLTINGGRIEGGQGVWMKSGTCVCTVTAGEIVGTAPLAAYVTSKNGFNSTGDAFVVDNVGYPGGAPAPSILGGTFVSSNANAVASYSNAANEPIDSFVAGGTFNTPVPADLCADGYEPDSWEEEGVTYYGVKPTSPATVITVACVNGATYTEANRVYTFGAAPEGYTVSSVFTNGVNANTTTTLDLSAAEGDIKVVVAATKTRTAPEHKWYENPGKVYSYTHAYAGGQDAIPGYNWAIESGNDYFLDTVGWNGYGAMLLDFNALEANAGTENALSKIWQYPFSTIRGGTVSKEHNVAIFGTQSGQVTYATQLSSDVADANGIVTNPVTVTFLDTDDTQLAGISMLRFSKDGKFLYAQADGKNYIYKFSAAADYTQNVTLKAIAKYDIGSEVRNFAYGVVNGTEVIFAGNSSLTVKLLDLSTGKVTATTVQEGYKYDQLNIAGSNLYIGHADNPNKSTSYKLLTQYAIGADFSLTQTREWTIADFVELTGATFYTSVTPMSFTVSDDEKSLLIAFQTTDTKKRYLIQYVEPPTYDITASVTAGTIATNGSAAAAGTYALLEGDTVVFTADTGATLKSVTIDGEPVQNVDTTATSYTYTVGTAAATVAVVFEASAPAGYAENDEVNGVTLTQAQADWLNGLYGEGKTYADKAAFDAAIQSGADITKCYLLNCDPTVANAGGTLTITAIVVGSDVKVTVELDRTGKIGAIKGTLCLYGAADLATGFGTEALGSVTFDDATFATKDTATATFTGTTEKFFKAVIE